MGICLMVMDTIFLWMESVIVEILRMVVRKDRVNITIWMEILMMAIGLIIRNKD